MEDFITTLYITFKLAILTTIFLLLIGLPLAYILSFKKPPFKTLWESIITVPLVLPPTVLGFYLLILFSSDSFIGKLINRIFNTEILFTFKGILIASIIYSLPFMVQPIQNGFKSLNKSLIEASYTLGKSEIETLFKVLIPNIKVSILTAIILTFAHTVGEFGVVLMVGGGIPGETLVASISIYNEVEALNYSTAHKYAFILLLISFISILSVNFLANKFSKE
ncbi:MAG: molybdate ABC transporter permease subunit [Persephonella sp.]|nr:MAG: molybdate ABC transporter permease subunit [Persephonella sp.]RUM62351.1 MAG: molybdate ABC transporter permease subunit [Persephonella sp.]